MAYTVDTLATEAQAFLATGDPQVTSANLILWYNRQQLELGQQTRWWYMRAPQTISVTLAGGSGSYPTAAGTKWLLSAEYLGVPLAGPIPLDQATSLYQGVATGPPSAMAFDASVSPPNFYVYPAPDATYSVSLVSFNDLADLTSGQSNILTNQFPGMVRDMMILAGFRRLQEDNQVAYYEKKIQVWLQTLQQAQREAVAGGLFSTPAPAYSAPHQ